MLGYLSGFSLMGGVAAPDGSEMYYPAARVVPQPGATTILFNVDSLPDSAGAQLFCVASEVTFGSRQEQRAQRYFVQYYKDLPFRACTVGRAPSSAMYHINRTYSPGESHQLTLTNTPDSASASIVLRQQGASLTTQIACLERSVKQTVTWADELLSDVPISFRWVQHADSSAVSCPFSVLSVGTPAGLYYACAMRSAGHEAIFEFKTKTLSEL